MLPSQQTSLGFCFANENDHVDSFELYLSPIMNCLSKLCNADLCYDILLTSLPGRDPVNKVDIFSDTMHSFFTLVAYAERKLVRLP